MDLEFVPHPIYGDKPRYTNLYPERSSSRVRFTYGAKFYTKSEREHYARLQGIDIDDFVMPFGEAIPGTAIVADTSKQVPALIYNFTHYIDIAYTCRDCERPFLFYAEEQKYWYEELQFPLEAMAVRCCPCRKKEQELKALCRRHEELCKLDEPSRDEQIEHAEVRLVLVEEGIFHPRQLQQIRAFFNKFSTYKKVKSMRKRVEVVEARADEG